MMRPFQPDFRLQSFDHGVYTLTILTDRGRAFVREHHPSWPLDVERRMLTKSALDLIVDATLAGLVLVYQRKDERP
jgi:hypothetical protein